MTAAASRAPSPSEPTPGPTGPLDRRFLRWETYRAVSRYLRCTPGGPTSCAHTSRLRWCSFSRLSPPSSSWRQSSRGTPWAAVYHWPNLRESRRQSSSTAPTNGRERLHTQRCRAAPTESRAPGAPTSRRSEPHPGVPWRPDAALNRRVHTCKASLQRNRRSRTRWPNHTDNTSEIAHEGFSSEPFRDSNSPAP